MTAAPAPGLYRLAYALIHPAARLLRGLSVEGVERLPSTGPVIVAANHVSWIDPPVVSMAVYSVRFPQFVAKEELFRVPGLGSFLEGIGCIPLDRSRGDVSALRRALSALSCGGCMVVFPEGTRSRDGRPGRPKPGVGFLARASGAPVVPARVFNTRSLLGGGPLRVRFGPPLRYEGGGGRADLQDFAERVMGDIFRLE